MTRSDSSFDYVTVGHVTRDVIERSTGDTVSQPGGGSFYSALQAARLGLRTLILTQGVPDEIQALLAPYLEELTVRVIPAQHTTVLAGPSGGSSQTQRVLAWAGPIVEPIELEAKILHFAPIARETPTSLRSRHELIAITPQGLIRRWEEAERVPLVQLDTGSQLGDIPLAQPVDGVLPSEISLTGLELAQLPSSFDAAVISEAECPNCGALFSAARECGAPVAVTAGPRPTTVHLPGNATSTRVVQTELPPTTAACDDRGAGDVFAAAFFIALSEGHTPLDAATLGNAAAAIRVAGLGPDAIGDRTAIEKSARPPTITP